MDKSKSLRYQTGGFSTTELLIIVIILGILSAIALPHFNMAAVSSTNGKSFVRKMMTDLRKTRQMAIANGADNTNGYSLQIAGSQPNQTYQIVNLQTGQTLETFVINPAIRCQGDTEFSFTSLGALKASGSKQMTITCLSKTYTLDIYPATGAVKCTGL